MSETCANCLFSEPLSNEMAVCRRYPPKMAGEIAPHGNSTFQDPQEAVWPRVKPEDYCGEWKDMAS